MKVSPKKFKIKVVVGLLLICFFGGGVFYIYNSSFAPNASRVEYSEADKVEKQGEDCH